MSIQVKHLTKIYDTQRALDDVSLDISTGEVVGLLGPNGAGKSTLMKIISGFLPQTSGQAIVCGFDVQQQSLEVRKKVGYLPENNPLYVDMYVREYLEFIGGIHQTQHIKSRVNEMIEMTGLQVEQKKKIGQLSKGYRQRVGLAQALFHDPAVLILDEPTSGLDPNQLADIRALIKSVGQTKTVLLSTHIMQEVEAMCSKIIIIKQGKIVTDGTTAQVQHDTQEGMLVQVEFSAAVATDELKKIASVVDAVELKTNTYELRSAGTDDIRPLIFNFAVSRDIAVLSMQKMEHSLEEAFQKLTK